MMSEGCLSNATASGDGHLVRWMRGGRGRVEGAWIKWRGRGNRVWAP